MSKELELARELVKQLEETERANRVQLSELDPGDVFKIGENDFIVLEHNYDTTTVISKGFMAENVVFDEDTRDYNKSNLKKVIEKCIQPVIESEVGVENLVEYDNSLLSVDNQKEFEPCRAKVMPPNFGLVIRFNNLIVNKDLDDWWWTCTPWSTADRGLKYSMSVVSPSGGINCYSCYSGNGVRPVCILKSNIFVSKGDK
ncbi:DUF6273 domain-containing protein [Eubacterium ramulus]